MLLLICLGFCGCYQGGEGQVDEQKNPYFVAGKERAAARDYKGAIEAFEKALEANAHSAQTHFELAVLYELHSDQKEEDYVAAMYHYNQAIKLRPNEHPADNARQRVAYCKRELVKGEALAPVAQNLMHDLEKLKQENNSLRKQLDSSQVQTGSRAAVPARVPSNRLDSAVSGASLARPAGDTASPSRPLTPSSSRERITPLPPAGTPAKTHAVKDRDTFFSIARQYHIKPDALISANPGLDPKRLKVGQTINIPST